MDDRKPRSEQDLKRDGSRKRKETNRKTIITMERAIDGSSSYFIPLRNPSTEAALNFWILIDSLGHPKHWAKLNKMGTLLKSPVSFPDG